MSRVPIAAPIIVNTSPSAALTALERAVHAGQLETVVAWYADEAVLMPPGELPVVGKADIRARYAELFARMRLTAHFEVEEERVMGSMGTIRGRMIGTRGTVVGTSEDQSGKFVMLFKKDRGRWLITALIWNADR